MTEHAPERGAQRERAKAERRKRIVDAARALIRESGEDGASMRAIAERADVSLATPYNLFGSKRAIVQALFDDATRFDLDFQGTAELSAIDRIFKALEMIFDFMTKDPDFYRVVWAILLDTRGSPELQTELVPPSSETFWTGLLQEAVAQSDLRDEVSSTRLHYELGKCFCANMLIWIQGHVEDDALYRATSFGYALILSGAATDRGRQLLRQHL